MKHEKNIKNETNREFATHLSKQEIIEQGSVYSPEALVIACKNRAKSYITDNDTVIDFGAGYGSFITKFMDCGKKHIAVENDPKAVEVLKKISNLLVLERNALKDVKKKQYGNDVVVVGNPPFNNVVSEYKRGQKGTIDADDDIKSNDIGVAFLKMYNKIEPKYIFVTHPLSYLIKEANFKSLKGFKDNYKLIDGFVFSSKHYTSISKRTQEFPVLFGIYKRNENGMDYEYIKNFGFETYKGIGVMRIGQVSTIDGKVNKYRKGEVKETDLQFYTMRDFNALKRNKTFLCGNYKGTIKVKKEDLAKYAWIDYVKNNFKPMQEFMFNNLSPVFPEDKEFEAIKEDSIRYILKTNNIVNEWFTENDPEFIKSHNRKPNYEKLRQALNTIEKKSYGNKKHNNKQNGGENE